MPFSVASSLIVFIVPWLYSLMILRMSSLLSWMLLWFVWCTRLADFLLRTGAMAEKNLFSIVKKCRIDKEEGTLGSTGPHQAQALLHS